jgi:uncharacterized protein YheU (UPF0270 family)
MIDLHLDICLTMELFNRDCSTMSSFTSLERSLAFSKYREGTDCGTHVRSFHSARRHSCNYLKTTNVVSLLFSNRRDVITAKTFSKLYRALAPLAQYECKPKRNKNRNIWPKWTILVDGYKP